MDNIDKEILLKKARRVLDKLENIRRIVSKHPSSYFSTIKRTKTVQATLIQAEAIIKVINGKETDLRNLVNNHMSMDDASANIYYVVEQLHTSIDKLEATFKPQLSLNEKQNLSGFREDLEKLKQDELEEIIYRDLEKSISELETPNYISSSMLSDRLTVHMINKIKGDGENKDADKVKKLQELEVIKKDEMSKTTSKYFLDASRSSRNLLLHEVGIIPSPSDANGYLATAIKMARIYVKYIKIIENSKKK